MYLAEVKVGATPALFFMIEPVIETAVATIGTCLLMTDLLMTDNVDIEKIKM